MKTHADDDARSAQRQPAPAGHTVQAESSVSGLSNGAPQNQESVQRARVPDLQSSPRMAVQRQALRASFGLAVQRQPDDPGQASSTQVHSAPLSNQTGMPDPLKAGIESLSGLDMSDVRVHANSDKPAQLNALAYAQGNDIHLGPGQEQHLPHEAWHVVQQRQGRVLPTFHAANGVGINDSQSLEHEADVMGAQSAQLRELPDGAPLNSQQQAPVANAVAQRMLGVDEQNDDDDGVETGWFVRWYSYDGTTYTPRTVSVLPGWIKRDAKYRGKDVYLSIEDFTNLEITKKVTVVAQQVRQTVDQYTPLLQSVSQRVDRQALDIENVREVQHQFLSLNTALGNYLSEGSTFLKILLATVGLTVTIAGGIILSYVTLPMWLVGLIDGLSLLYGMYVLYRWTSSELLPGFIKVALVLANALAMVGATAPVLGQAGAYLLGLTETMPLQHITLAAIPFALVIEQIIVMMIEKVNAARQVYNQRNQLGNEDHRD